MSLFRIRAGTIKRRLVWPFLFAVVFCGSGCLEFDQIVFLLFAKDRDEVRALVVYERLDVGNKETVMGHTGSLKPGDLGFAKKCLAELFMTDHAFYLFSKIPIWLKTNKEDRKETREAIALLQRHLTIRKGSFFFDKEGRLCGTQTIVVRQVHKLIETLNERIAQQVMATADEGLGLERSKLEPDMRERWADCDDESLRILRRAARAKHRWLRLEAGRLSFTLPGKPELFARLKRRFLRELAEKKDKAWVTWFSQTPWSIDEGRDRLTISVGAGDWEPFRLSLAGTPKKKSKFQDDLVKYAKSLGVPFMENVTTETLIADFQRQGGIPKKAPRVKKNPDSPRAKAAPANEEEDLGNKSHNKPLSPPGCSWFRSSVAPCWYGWRCGSGIAGRAGPSAPAPNGLPSLPAPAAADKLEVSP
jgi:hypothetical protein